MPRLTTTVFAICCLLFALPVRSQNKSASGVAQTATAKISGTVRDPKGDPAPHASLSLSTPTETIAQSESNAQGQFSFAAPAEGTYRLAASLPGLAAMSDDLELQPGETRQVDLSLKLSAVDQHVVVSASFGNLMATDTASSVSVVTAGEIASRDAQGISDVLLELPGTTVADAGRRGGETGVFVRGGNSNYNLVMVDGIPLNQFGGDFDFSPLPTDGVAQVEVVRGAESALYGPDAVTSVVNLVTPTGEGAPHFDALAEGGSYDTYRLSTGGAGAFHGLSWSYDLSRLGSAGVVENDNYRNQTAFVSLRYSRSPRRQFVVHFFGDANNAGVPGPYGSDPDNLFPGVDTVSRDNQNLFGYQIGETEQFSSRIRQVSTVSVSTDRYFFTSPPALGGDSFENSYKIVANTRSEITLAPTDLLVAGFEYNREDYEDTFVADAESNPFVLARTSLAPFAENRWNPSRRWTLITGIRVDDILTESLPPDAFGERPLLPASTVVQVNPRGAIGYLLRQGGTQSAWGATRLHASGGTGIRPPDGFELGFTNNPNLKPERSITTDVGIEQRLLGDRAVAGVTYFYNRFFDQIVTLGGSLANLSTFTSANLNNSRAQGLEFSLHLQPIRSLEISGQYTWMDSVVLALDGTTLADFPYQAGQPLIRRPRNSGSYDVTWRRGRFRLNSNAYARGWVLDLEPNDGAFACELDLPCLFRNHGYVLVNAGFGIRTFHDVELFGQLNNLLDQKYEEVFGYPSYRLNFTAGIRLNFSSESPAAKRP
jgi:outer membrane receptor protein involved in Fe transport